MKPKDVKKRTAFMFVALNILLALFTGSVMALDNAETSSLPIESIGSHCCECELESCDEELQPMMAASSPHNHIWKMTWYKNGYCGNATGNGPCIVVVGFYHGVCTVCGISDGMTYKDSHTCRPS